ncbi:MAG: PAS domain S-box protein [Halobacteria archaeon]
MTNTLDRINDGFAVVQDSSIQYVNQEFLDLLGYEKNEVLGREISELVSSEDEDLLLQKTSVHTDTEIEFDEYEVNLLSRNRNKVPVSVSLTPIEYDGKPATLLLINESKTKDQSREEPGIEERTELNYYKQAVESSDDLIAAIDTDHRYLFANESYREYHSVSGPIEGREVADVLSQEDFGVIKRYLKRVLDGETVEYEMKRSGSDDEDGEHFHIQYYPLRDVSGATRGVVGSMRNVTAVKESKKESRKIKKKYRTFTEDVMELLDVAIMVVDEGQKVVWVNEAVREYFGIDTENIIGTDVRDLVRDRLKPVIEDGEGYADAVLASYDQGIYTKQLDCRVKGEGDLSERWLEYSSKPIKSGLYSGGRIEKYADVTDRKDDLSELRKSNRRLELALEGTDSGVWSWNINENKVSFSSSMNTVFDFDVGTGDTFDSFRQYIHPDDLDHFDRELEKAVELGENYSAEYRLVSGDDVRWVKDSGKVFAVQDGKKLISVMSDVTERKRKDKELMVSEKRLSLAVDAANAGVWEWNMKEDEFYWDESMNQLLGRGEGEFTGRYDDFVRQIYSEDLELFEEEVWKTVNEGESFETEFRLKRGDEKRWVLGRGIVMRKEDEEPLRLVGICLPI